MDNSVHFSVPNYISWRIVRFVIQLQKLRLYMRRNSNNQLGYLTEHYQELVDQVFRFTYLKTSNREIAEELTSECFLSTITYLKDHNVENIRAFLFKVARNKIIDYYRQKDRVIYSDEVVLAHEPSSGADEVMIMHEAKMVAEKIRLLPDDDREVLTLRYLEDLEIREIADIIGKSQVATRVQIFRALRKARELFMGNNKQ